MWVRVTINSYELVVLINSGFTHNFFSEKIANVLQVLVKPIEPFNIKVANKGSLTCQGRFEDIPILIQGIPFLITFYALHLYGLDLVLGILWLE